MTREGGAEVVEGGSDEEGSAGHKLELREELEDT